MLHKEVIAEVNPVLSDGYVPVMHLEMILSLLVWFTGRSNKFLTLNMRQNNLTCGFLCNPSS